MSEIDPVSLTSRDANLTQIVRSNVRDTHIPEPFLVELYFLSHDHSNTTLNTTTLNRNQPHAKVAYCRARGSTHITKPRAEICVTHLFFFSYFSSYLLLNEITSVILI